MLPACPTIAAVAWWRTECPVRPEEQAWIDESMDWLRAQFGNMRLYGAVVLPTDDYFPGVYEGSREDVLGVVARIAEHMDVDRNNVDVEFEEDEDDGRDVLPVHWEFQGAAGDYRVVDGRSIIGIRRRKAEAPMALVATIAHELGHYLLDGHDRRPDLEPLTDLLTVYFGLGIFSANAAFEYSTRGRTRQGYLTEPMYGYGLARYALMRGEPDPAWARHLDTNPRSFLKQGLRYLHRS